MNRLLLTFCFSLLLFTSMGFCQVADFRQRLSEGYSHLLTEPEKSAIIGLELGSAAKNSEQKEAALRLTALAYQQQGDYSEAKERLEILIAQKKSSSDSLWKNYQLFGLLEEKMSLFPSAIRSYVKAIEALDTLSQVNHHGELLNQIGNIYRLLEEPDNAMKYLMQASFKFDETGNRIGQAGILNNLGNTMIGYGRYPEALKAFHKANQLNLDQAYDKTGKLYYNIGYTHKKAGNYDSAFFYLEKARKIRENLNDPERLGRVLTEIADTYDLKGKYQNAIAIGKRALLIIHQTENLRLKRTIHGALSDAYSHAGDFKTAYRHEKLYEKYDREIVNESNARELGELESALQLSRQEQENNLLKQEAAFRQAQAKQQKRLVYIILIALFITLGFAAFVLRAYYQRKKLSEEIRKRQEQTEKDKRLIEEQAEKLQRLDETKSRFFANISHDLRTPITLISGYLEQLKEEIPEVIRQPDLYDGLERNSLRLINLVEEINDLTKLEAGQFPFLPVRIRPSAFFKLLVRLFESGAEAKQIQLDYSIKTPADYLLAADPNGLEKVLCNLLANSLRFTPTGGKVEVTLATSADNDFILTVSDTGKGIPEKALPHIFERYFQAPNQVHQLREGSGIGLSIVKEIVELHHGTISVESEEGKGTKFQIVLPALSLDSIPDEIVEFPQAIESRKKKYKAIQTDQAEELEAMHQAIGLETSEKEKARLLLVDDHPEVRNYLASLLKTDFELIEAANGEAALKILERYRADLVITDLMMPYMDGFDLIENLRNHPDWKSLPVMVVSARTDEETRNALLQQGIRDILAKPFNRKELVVRAKSLIKESREGKMQPENETSAPLPASRQEIKYELIAQVDRLIAARMDDSNLGVLDLAEELAASERKVNYLMKELTGMTPQNYIREVRWRFAEKLLTEKRVQSVSEAARQIGMNNVTYFSKQYEKRFGKKPDYEL